MILKLTPLPMRAGLTLWYDSALARTNRSATTTSGLVDGDTVTTSVTLGNSDYPYTQTHTSKTKGGATDTMPCRITVTTTRRGRSD